jgi:Spy/CpxP family protein refolding chaperone
MRRFLSLFVATSAAGALIGWTAPGLAQGPKAAAEKKPASKPETSAAPEAWAASPLYSLPGFWMLGQENVQKELELTAEQRDKLLAIAKKSQDQTRQDWTQFAKLPAKERADRMKELRDKTARRAALVYKAVEAVLTPSQLERVQEIRFRLQVVAMLQDPQTLEQLGLTDQQKQELRRLREELQKKLQEVQQENTEKTLRVLSPEQIEKLKKMPNPAF